MNLLSVSGISKQKDKEIILQDISFEQQKLQKIAVAGETGSGKSTLLKIIAGLVQPDTGMVLFDQERVLGPQEKLLPGHKSIAYLSQHFELRNNYLVEEELQYTNKMTEEEAATIFEICRISHLLKRKTDQLSGGEKQRIVTARLLISSPRLLLLDEPFSNLDTSHKNMMKAVIWDICETLKITCILVSHDPSDTLSWASEILVLKDGCMQQKGTPLQIYTQPANTYTAGLFGKYSLLPPSLLSAFTEFILPAPGKKALLRPEHFTIVAAGAGVEGTVRKITYFGSYCEAKVLINGSSITITTERCSLAPGDTIHVSASAANTWYLKD